MKKQLLSLALLSAAWLACGSAQAHDGDHSYTNGICTIDECTDKYQPAEKVDGVYLLGNVGNVEWMSAKVGAGETEPGDGGKPYAICSYKLTADIDYADLGVNAHKPIGTYDKKFLGVFDGGGHSIKNMKLDQPTRPKPNEDGIGFFGCVRVGNEVLSKAVIKDLTIDSSCEVKGSSAYVAGLLGRIHQRTESNELLIENCVNKANVTTSANHVAGIVGQMNTIGGATVTIQNCVNKGSITTTGGYAAGILAQINDAGSATVNVKGCINEGAVTCAGLCAAGIVSQANNCTVALNIESCMNLAAVKSTGNKNCGGIFGANTSSKSTIHIVNCGNTGNVTGTSESAAITGWIGSNSDQEITNCWNSGTVTGHSGTNMYMYRDKDSSTTATNLYDTSGGTQGTAITNADITSGKLCYKLNGDQTSIKWYQLIGTDAYPMPAKKSGAQVYNVDLLHCATGTTDTNGTYSNTDATVRDHSFDNNTGLCSCSYPKADWLSLTDGYYELGSVEEIEWFGAMVREAKNGLMKGKLVDDIDFTDKTHTPIGPTSGAKFFGEFDGQGHTISNLTLDSDDNAGFFLWVRGGSTIKNLIMDSSCSFHATNRAAAFVCVIQAAAGGAINIENCINKAAVSSENLVSSAFVAACNWENSDQPALNLTNCCNTGNITHNGTDCAAAIFGWNKGTCIIKGCYNTGTIYPLDSDKRNLVRSEAGKTASIIDTYDLSETPEKAQGVKTDWTTENPISSGELCYFLNGDQSEIGWRQTIGTDTEPKLFGSSQQVYVQGSVDCTSTPVGDFTFSNTEGTIQLDHNINAEIGMCDICHTQFQEPALVSDWYELRNAGNVEWYSQYVATAGGTHKSAKLMNDIDFLGIENLHSPIGPNAENKFNATFNGQGCRIKNLIINRPDADNQGFFGWLRGNNADTRIENLIIDKSCSFTARGDVGALSGNSQNSGRTIYLHNIVNEANVTGSGQNVAGLVASNGNNSKWDIRNCVNAGNIKSTHATPYAGAVGGYLGNNGQSVIENFINTGKIEGYNGTNRLGRWYGQTTHNIIDAGTEVNSSNNYYCPESATSGALTYYANKQAGSDVFYQLIGTDTHPVLDISHKQVILNGTYQNTASTLALSDMNSFGTNSNFDVTSVTMERTLKAGKWNTFCVPFDMTAAEITDQLGSGTEVKELTGATPNGENYTMTFSDASSIVAGKPYMVKVPGENDVTSFTLSNKTIKGTITPATAGDVTFTGVYNNGNAPQGSFIISNNVFYNVDSEVTLKAFRGYITVDSGSGVKALTFDFDDDATGIEGVQEVQEVQGAIYNLAGQRIQKMQKGINIVNGKKILK